MKILKVLFILSILVSCDSAKKNVETEISKPKQENTSTSNTVKSIHVVTADEVKKVVSFLASDDLKGRNTGTEGINLAANYIETQFKEFGLKPYFESFRDNFNIGESKAYNVVGYLEGNDANLKDQYIVIGAHYDHIGNGTEVEGDVIANGANDNAAGTSAVLALAKYFGKNKTNKRSMIFVTFTAEEMGLLGSKHLAKKLKEQDLNLYTMINFEMIGVPFKDRDYQAFVSGYELSNLAERMNNYSGSNLIGYSSVSKKYNLFKRSDNYPFYEAFNAPCQTVSSCDLTNFDFYHHVDDEVDKLDFQFMSTLINKMTPVIEQMANTTTQEIKMNEN